MKKNVKRITSEASLFTLVMLLAMQLFSLSGEQICPLTVVTAIAAVAIGFTEIITALREVID